MGPAYVDRRQAAGILDSHESAVRRAEGRGLTPVRRPGQATVYLADEVHALVVARARGKAAPLSVYSGDEAAAAFERFEAGESDVRIVVDMHMRPEVVRQLRIEFSRSTGGAITLSDEDLQALCFMAAFRREQLTSGAVLVKKVREFLGYEMEREGRSACTSCGKGATLCGTCAFRSRGRSDHAGEGAAAPASTVDGAQLKPRDP